MSFQRRMRRQGGLKRLAWSPDEYTLLKPADLDRRIPPTLAQRIRVAAALATRMRDEDMTGQESQITAEAIRAILVMDDEAWAAQIEDFKGSVTAYDPVDPRRRIDQTRNQIAGRS